MKVTAVQMKRGSISESIQKSKYALHQLEKEEPDLVVLPEKWVTEKITESDPAFLSLMELFQNFSEEHNCSIIPGSFSLVRSDGTFNSAPMISSGRLLGFQDKISLYRAEKVTYSQGDSIKVFKTGNAPISIAVCYDLDFPYFTKIAVKRGARILANPSLINEKFHEMWWIYARGRSLENRIPIISVNSLSAPFNGNSIITGLKATDDGVLLQDHFCGKEPLATIDLDLSDIEDAMDKRINEDPGSYSLEWEA